MWTLKCIDQEKIKTTFSCLGIEVDARSQFGWVPMRVGKGCPSEEIAMMQGLVARSRTRWHTSTQKRRKIQRIIGLGVLAVFALVAVKTLFEGPAKFALISLNGLTLGALYFLVASGFSLIFGVMRVVNMAHGSFYLLGGYIGSIVLASTGSWMLALLVGGISIALVGVVVQQGLLRRVQGDDMREALITIGLSIIAADLMIAFWGGAIKNISPPTWAMGSQELAFGISYPKYRLFVLVLALIIGLILWFILQRTRTGMIVRAAVDDRRMVSALGVNVEWIYAAVFALAALLAGLSGVVGGTFIALGPGEDQQFLLVSLIVVIVGGLGSLSGTALSAVLVGLVDQFAAVYDPTYSVLYVFAVLVVFLAFRPQGMFGRAG